VAASASPRVLLEVVAATEDKDSETAGAGSSPGRSGESWLQSQRFLANVRQPSDSNGHAHYMADRTRIVEP